MLCKRRLEAVETHGGFALALAVANPVPVRQSRLLGLRPAVWIPLGLLMVAIPTVWIDLPVSQFCIDRVDEQSRIPEDFRKLLMLAEVFSHGTGVALTALAMFFMDRGGRRTILRVVVCCGYVSGLLAVGMKQLVARIRPYDFDYRGDVFETFVGWLPVIFGDASNLNVNSFPSAHTATAAGLAVGLSWRYPQGRPFFVLMALLSACQRVEMGSHYVTDTLVGAALGSAFALACVAKGTWFDRFESEA